MSAHNHGSLPSTGIVSKTVYENTDSGFSITKTLVCDSANLASNTPAIGTVHPTAAAYTLKKATQEPIGSNLWQISLQYIAFADSLPSVTYSEQSSYVEVPIQEHPNFASWAADWDEDNQRFLASSTKAGITSYIKGTTTVIKTTYYSSKPSPPYGEVGTLESPGGDYGDSGHWLIIGATRQKVGSFWAIEKTYLYSSKEYDTDIY